MRIMCYQNGGQMFKRVILIFICILNMLTITYFSTQSAEQSNKVSQGVTEKIVISVSDKPQEEVKDEVRLYNGYIRSFAHFFMFLTLGIALYLTLRSFECKYPFWYTFLICFLYAVFDELYQKLLNKGRAFEVVDLLKDWSGALVGILGIWGICKVVKIHKINNEKMS